MGTLANGGITGLMPYRDDISIHMSPQPRSMTSLRLAGVQIN